jgi:xanthine dehydrogenase accessory factor
MATVVRRVAPASAQPGAKALILPDGSMRGWVGGSCAQSVVISEARQAIRTGMPRLLRLGQLPGAVEQDDVVEYPMTCHSGGALEILIEPVLPAPQLIIVGETPVAETLASLATVMGYRIGRLDRAAGLTEALHARATTHFVVVASMGVDDEEALMTALRAGVPYCALVASPTRAAVMRETLTADGARLDELSRLKAPAGLNLGGRTQEEIALSIMAEIAQTRAATSPGLAGEARKIAVDSNADAEIEATDPVCGMTVVVAKARHQVEVDGKTWYFCCAGCKAQFAADPHRFTAA